MTAKTRYFLIGSVLVLVVGLSIGLVAYYGGMPSGLFSSQRGPDELKYVPEDAAVVAYANVKDVMNSELRQRLRRFQGASEEGRNEFKTQTGIDIERDIDHVVACVGAKTGVKDHRGLAVVSGRFDPTKIEALATAHGGTVEQYKGKRIVLAKGHGSEAPEQELAMAFLAPGVVALGTSDMVRLAVDRGNGGGSVRGNAELMKLVENLDNPSLWAVGRFDALSAHATLPSEVTERMPPLTWFTASGRVNGGLQAVVKAEAKDEQGATNLRDIIRGFVALAKMQTDSKPGIKAMLPDVQLSGEGKEVAVSFAVTTEMLDAIEAARAVSGHLKNPDKGAPKQ
jgi:hypothetical protein